MYPDPKYFKVYTLAIPFNDEVHSILNGRIFKIKKDPYDHLHFIDPIGNEDLVESTSVESRQDFNNGYSVITTVSGTIYHLRRLSSLLPTMYQFTTDEFIKGMEKMKKDNEQYMAKVEAEKEEAEKKAVESANVSELEIISTKHNTKEINYGDGFDEVVYTFNRAISKAEFIAWCESRGLRMESYKDVAWYEDYTVITSFGDLEDFSSVWSYKRINRYTD